MIQLGPKPPVPALLQSKKVNRAYRKIKAKVANGDEIKAKEFPSYWLEDDVRLLLWEYQHRKCCYCERQRDPKGEPDIEHFRPKTKIEGEGKPGYWWLAYDWDNLFFSCKKCNQTKSARFPVRGTRARNPQDNLSLENPVLPHPQHENPEELIGWRWEFKPDIALPYGKDDDERGSQTLRILGLRRYNLAEERGRSLLSLQVINMRMQAALYCLPDLIQQIAGEIERETRSDNPFAGFRRAFFHTAGLGKYVSAD